MRAGRDAARQARAALEGEGGDAAAAQAAASTDGHAREVDDDREEGSMRARASSRRLRSRNAFIDAELGKSGHANDSYADLEDFIVCKRGRRY